MKLRKCLISILAIGMGACLLSNFVSIWIFGKYYIYESNRMILGIETLMMIIIISYSLFSLFSDFRYRSDDSFDE
jgi:hypothetical protein